MDSFINNLKQQVQCFSCKETLIEPRVLHCFHIYCKSCLKNHIQVDDDTNTIECPRCDSRTVLQDLNDFEDFETSPVHSRILKVLEILENLKICSVSSSHPEALWQCLECDRSLCEQCLQNHSEFIKDHRVVSLSDLKKKDVEKMLKKESPCEIHDKQEVEFHCKDCDMLICALCLKAHRSHKTTTLQEFVKTKRDSMTEYLKKIQQIISIDEKEKKKHEEIALKIQRDGKRAAEKIKKMAKNLIQEVNRSEQQLLNQVKIDIMNAERNLRILCHATQAYELVSHFVEGATARDLASNRHQQISCQAFIYDPYPQDATGLVFDHNGELCKQLENFRLGLARPFKKPDLNKSTITIEPQNITAGTKTKLTLDLKTSTGDVTDGTLEDMIITFTPEDNVEVTGIRMTDQNEITVDFIPIASDPFTVEIEGRWYHFDESSPIADVIKKSQQTKLMQSLNAGSKYFSGIAVDKTNSKIAIADHEGHCVRVYNMVGVLLLKYGCQGSGEDELKYPRGLAFLNETELVIADYHNHRICIVNTTTGQLVRTFGSSGTTQGRFNSPYDVHVDEESNTISVCDYCNSRVQVFTKDGDYLYQFAVPGNPYSVVSHNGRFYVSDKDHSVISVIQMKDNMSPTTVLEFGETALKSACGLAIDNDKNLLVCDNYANVVHMFTLDGRHVGQSNKLDNSPRCIAALNDGRVICATWRGGVVFVSL